MALGRHFSNVMCCLLSVLKMAPQSQSTTGDDYTFPLLRRVDEKNQHDERFLCWPCFQMWRPHDKTNIQRCHCTRRKKKRKKISSCVCMSLGRDPGSGGVERKSISFGCCQKRKKKGRRRKKKMIASPLSRHRQGRAAVTLENWLRHDISNVDDDNSCFFVLLLLLGERVGWGGRDHTHWWIIYICGCVCT